MHALRLMVTFRESTIMSTCLHAQVDMYKIFEESTAGRVCNRVCSSQRGMFDRRDVERMLWGLQYILKEEERHMTVGARVGENAVPLSILVSGSVQESLPAEPKKEVQHA